MVEKFKCFIKLKEPSFDLDNPLHYDIVKLAEIEASLLVKNLKSYLNEQEYNYLLFNVWLHKIIVNPSATELYEKYDIVNQGMITSSVSNSGSSVSIQSFKSLDEGEFMMLDLYRTPYGKAAYSILESCKSVAIVLG